ncbi:MAG: hypothetical protein ABSE73_03155 [Planctomycetota bacterium]
MKMKRQQAALDLKPPQRPAGWPEDLPWVDAENNRRMQAQEAALERLLRMKKKTGKATAAALGLPPQRPAGWPEDWPYVDDEMKEKEKEKNLGSVCQPMEAAKQQ